MADKEGKSKRNQTLPATDDRHLHCLVLSLPATERAPSAKCVCIVRQRVSVALQKQL